MLGQIIVDNQYVFTLLHEVFAHRAACIRRDILHRRKLGSRCTDNNGIFHSASTCQLFNKLCHRGILLTDRNINTDDILAALVDDGVRRNSGFTCLTIANDQLALAAANRNHAVNGLDARLKRHTDALTFNDARCRAFNRSGMAGLNFAFSIHALSKCVDDAANQLFANRNGNNAPRATNDAAFVQAHIATQNNNGDGIFFQVKRHAIFAVFKLDQLVGHAAFKSAGTGDTVSDQNDRTGFVLLKLLIVLFDLGLNDF